MSDDISPEDVADMFQEFVDEIPEEATEAHKHRLESTPECGIYEHARLTTPDDTEFVLSSAHYWTTDHQGRHLVDIHHSELPTRQLTGLSLQIRADDGVPLLAGRIVDVGRENGLGGDTTLIVGDPRDGDTDA